MINKKFTPDQVSKEVQLITHNAKSGLNMEALKTMFSCIDLTTLNTTDSESHVRNFVSKVNVFPQHYPDINPVAAICVYPVFVPLVNEVLNNKSIHIASVSGGFPSSQTFLAVKLAETNLAVERGADEIDMVISVGTFLDKQYDIVAREISLMKAACGKAHLKVILETGALPGPDEIYTASLIAMEAGADFIKTSTGKLEPAATTDAVFVMANAIKDYHANTGRMVGLKPAGGIATVDVAYQHYSIVKEVLGDPWLNNTWFRIGASRLANHLIQEIQKSPDPVKYF